jgi:hypothetical protein
MTGGPSACGRVGVRLEIRDKEREVERLQEKIHTLASTMRDMVRYAPSTLMDAQPRDMRCRRLGMQWAGTSTLS